MKELLIEFKKWIYQWFVIFLLIWVIVTFWVAVDIEIWIDNTTWYIQKMLFTTDWTVQNWDKLKVIVDGEKWSINMSGDLRIVEWAFKDWTILWEDIVDWQVTNGKIWDWQVTNINFADDSITNDKILDWTIQSINIWDGQVNNTKLIKTQPYTFNKFIDTDNSSHYVNSEITSNLNTLSWVNLEFNRIETPKITIWNWSYSEALWVWWDIKWTGEICGKYTGKYGTIDSYCIWDKPLEIWTISNKWRCKYDWSKIQCIETFWD